MSQRFGCCFDADFVGLLNQCLHNDCIGKYIQGMPVKTPPASFYSAESLRPEGTIGLLMKRVMQSVLLQIDRRLAVHDLTHAQWLPLYRISRGGCDTMAALARDQSLDPGAMTRALDRLEAKGLVRRERSQQDRRVIKLELTDSGRAVSQHVPAVLAEVLNAHLAGFAESEWLMLNDLLQRMLANGEALRDCGKDLAKDSE